MENFFLKNTSFNSIELGIIKSHLTKNLYQVNIAGVDRKIYNTSINDLNIGDKVLVSKLQSGVRYIITKTGFFESAKESTKVYING